MLNGIKSKKVMLLVIIMVCSIVLFGVIIFVIRYNDVMSRQYPDLNGDSKELCIIPDDLIEEYYESYDAIGVHRYSEGLYSSGVKNTYEHTNWDFYDNSYTEMSAKRLSGMIFCNIYLGSGKEVTYKIDSTVKSGNMKIIITNDDGKIIYELPIDQESTVSFVAEENRLYFLKFVGESARFEAVMHREEK